MAIVSAALFVVLAALLAVAPVPFVTWAPGQAIDLLSHDNGVPMIQVSGATAYDVTGELWLAPADQTNSGAQVTLPEALLAHWIPDSAVVPRSWAYQPGTTTEQLEEESAAESAAAMRDATVAALRAAKIMVQEVPMVESVAATGPSADKLFVGDLILSVDGLSVKTKEDVTDAIQLHQVNDTVTFTVLRSGKEVEIQVTAVGQNAGNRRLTVVGISTAVGYLYEPTVTYSIEPGVANASAGLAMALGTYDMLTPDDLLADMKLSGAGSISADGHIGRVDAIEQKIKSAASSGAEVFLVPAGNCSDLAGIRTTMTLVKVDTLAGTIEALKQLGDPENKTEVPHC